MEHARLSVLTTEIPAQVTLESAEANELSTRFLIIIARPGG